MHVDNRLGATGDRGRGESKVARGWARNCCPSHSGKTTRNKRLREGARVFGKGRHSVVRRGCRAAAGGKLMSVGFWAVVVVRDEGGRCGKQSNG